MNFYNNHRPHSSLGDTPPDVFYRRIINATHGCVSIVVEILLRRPPSGLICA
jgi:hypothetical protein